LSSVLYKLYPKQMRF